MKLQELLYAGLFLMGATACTGKSVEVTVTNDSETDRNGELVEIYREHVQTKLRTYESLVVLDESGAQVPYQLTNDGTILFPVSVKAGEEAVFTIKEGMPETADTVCCGAVYPKRLDDLAFENDRMGWRVYGPGSQQRNYKLYGYDLWSKRTEQPVLAKFYDMDRRLNEQKAELGKEGKKMSWEEEQKLSYHVDHGEGCDYYAVGPTLGAGTAAFISPSTGEMIYPWCYKTCEILDNGPLRFTARLTYDLVVSDVEVRETRLLSLDKGSQMVKCTVWYTNIFSQLPLAAGVVMHKGSDQVDINAEEGYAAYVEPANETNGTNYLGLYFPERMDEIRVQPLSENEEEAAKGGATGHLVGMTTYSPDAKFTYYFGAGYSKHGFGSAQEWFDYMKKFAAEKRKPLKVRIK